MTDIHQAATTAVKSLSEDGSRIGGYLIVWGSPQARDLQGEWFTPETDLCLDLYPLRPIFYDHGADRTIKATMIGVIDTLKADEVGLWCEGQLDRHNRYVRAVQQLVAKGALGWSSGSLPHLVIKSADGEIVRWPVIEGSVTPVPAEPRHTTVAAIKSAVREAYQALGLDFSPLEPSDLQEQGMSEEMQNNLKTVAETVSTLAESVKSLHHEIAATRTAPIKRLPVPSSDPAPSRIEVLRATKYSDLSAGDMSFLYEIMAGSVRGWNPGDPFFRELADKSFRAVNGKELGYDAVKGLVERGYTKANELDTTTQAGYGQEWAPDSWRSELWMRVRQDNVVAPLFSMIEMPTQPFELPIETTDPTVYYVPETTDSAQLVYGTGNPITLSKIGSSKIQMNAKKLALRVSWSSELNEDSLIPVIANYRRQSLRAMQNAIDNVLVNGDTATGANANVNLIDGTPSTGTKYLAFNGLRKYCLVTNTSQAKDGAGTPTLPLLRVARFLLSGAYAIQPRNCAWIVDDSVYAKLLNLPEFATMDKAGPNATNLTGQVGVIDGVPVFATAELGLTQATGKISGTPSNNIKGQALCVFRPGWMIGYRRQVQATVEYVSFADAYHLIVTARLTLVNFDNQSASILYDLSV